jgi:hypothetical protein
MPNWTGDDGVSDYKGADEPCEPTHPLAYTVDAVQILKSIHLRHNEGIELDVLQVVVGGVGHSHACYVILHDDLANLLTLAGERLQEKTRKRGSKKRPALSYPKDKKRRAPKMKRSLTRAQVRAGRKMKGAMRRG